MSAAAKQVEDEWGTTAEKLFKYLGTKEAKDEVRRVAHEFFAPPLLEHLKFLAPDCELDEETFAVATAIVIVRGTGTEYIASVSRYLAEDEEVSGAKIRDNISTAFYLYNWSRRQQGRA